MSDRFDTLVLQARQCQACAAMTGQRKILSAANGPHPATVMLIGEAPGRLGAARTGTPFQGDESGRRLERLLEAAGWRRDDLFISNAVLCNPLDETGRNRTPRSSEVANCSGWLQQQIKIVNPSLVVALGAVALRGLNAIEEHGLKVKSAGQQPVPWLGRYLAACYHPGARAAIHRPVDLQLADFSQLGHWLRANGGSGVPR